MGTDETTGDETTDEAEVEGQAMGIPPLGSLDPALPGTGPTSTARKAGEKPVEYLKVKLNEAFITSVE